MANIFGDMRIDRVTPKELEAMRTILNSERAAVMLKELNKAFATLDSKAPTWLLNILTEIISYVTTLANNHISSMQNWVGTLGRMLTLDTTKSGSRKGEPNFLTAHFRDLADASNWDVLVYMYEFCNFKDAAQKVEYGVYSEMPTAKSRCVGNKLAAAYIGRFVKFLDDLKVKPIKELVAYDMLCKTYPGIKEMIEWCRDNRDKWDNFKEFYAENYKKGQAY